MTKTWTTDNDGNLRCEACGNRGMVECPIDHKSQKPNARDEQGEYFDCIWDGTQGCDNMGWVHCPVCGNESNMSTYIES